MALIYITGVAGSGKSTVRLELLHRGYKAFGGSEDNIAAFYSNSSGKIKRSTQAEHTSDWLSRHSWKIPKATIEKLRFEAKDNLVFVCSFTANDKDELWELFDEVFVLAIDESTQRNRILNRTNSDWGKTSNELNAILKSQNIDYKGPGVIIDATQPVAVIVDEILKQARVFV